MILAVIWLSIALVYMVMYIKSDNLSYLIVSILFLTLTMNESNYRTLKSDFADMKEAMCIVEEQPTLRNLTTEEENEITTRT